MLSGKRPTAVRTSWRKNPHLLISASSHLPYTTTRLSGMSGPKTSASRSQLRHQIRSWSKTRRSKAAALKQHLSLMHQRCFRAMAPRAASIRKPVLHQPACPGTVPRALRRHRSAAAGRSARPLLPCPPPLRPHIAHQVSQRPWCGCPLRGERSHDLALA